MTLIEKIEVMKHYESGGNIDFRPTSKLDINKWEECLCPLWNWHSYEYRIKPKSVELLYEWWYISNIDGRIFTTTHLQSEKEANYNFNTYVHGKTGRWFNPETKEFGGLNDTTR